MALRTHGRYGNRLMGNGSSELDRARAVEDDFAKREGAEDSRKRQWSRACGEGTRVMASKVLLVARASMRWTMSRRVPFGPCVIWPTRGPPHTRTRATRR